MPEQTTFPGRSALRALLPVLLFLALTGLIVAWIEAIGGPEAVRARYGWRAPAITLPAHLAVNVIAVGEFIPWSVANGVVYGFGGGTLLTWLAWMGSALVQYRLAARLARTGDLEARLARLPGRLRRLPVHHPLFLIAGRWVPMGGPLTNLAAGARGVPFRRLCWCAAVGYAPEAALNAAVGAGLLQLI